MKPFATALVTAIFLLYSLGGKTTSAFDKEDLEQLKTTNSCPSCDLQAADLNYVDLAGANLANADLRKAQLFMTNLRGANLTGANLAHANLAGAR